MNKPPKTKTLTYWDYKDPNRKPCIENGLITCEQMGDKWIDRKTGYRYLKYEIFGYEYFSRTYE